MTEGFLTSAFKHQRPQLEMHLDDNAGTDTVTAALREVLERLDAASYGASYRAPGQARDGRLRTPPASNSSPPWIYCAPPSSARSPPCAPPPYPRPTPSPARRSPFPRIAFLGLGGDDEDSREAEARELEEQRRRQPPRPTVHTLSLLTTCRPPWRPPTGCSPRPPPPGARGAAMGRGRRTPQSDQGLDGGACRVGRRTPCATSTGCARTWRCCTTSRSWTSTNQRGAVRIRYPS